MATNKPDGVPTYTDGFPVYPVTRNWDTDYARLIEMDELLGPTQTATQNTVPLPAATSPNSPITQSTLPKFGSGFSQLPNRFRQKNAQGKTWGIDLVEHLINTAEGVVATSLIEEMKLALRELGFIVLISSANSARGHVAGSRHGSGLALDLNKLDSGGGFRLCALDNPNVPTNPDAVRLAQWFIAHGYKAGTERGNARALLFGNSSFGWNKTGVDHKHHIHISHSRTLK
ncbi:MAG TPA: hypothetical protein VEP90_11270 [Methylomirabilota bacterium]|nr:hypothetical protein [Methylomirabilota bacterium]